MHRVLFLVALSLGVLLDELASAATFLADAVCVGGRSDPHEGIGQVEPSTCSVFSYPNNRFSPAGTASEDSLAFASAGPSGLFVNATHFLFVAGARSGQGGSSTQTYAEWNFDDFVITGPGSTPIPAALHLFISGSMGATGSTDDQGSLTSVASGGGNFFIDIRLNGARTRVGQTSYGWSNGTIQEQADGPLEGHVHGGAISDIITSDQLMLPVGQVYSVHVDVSANANGFVRIVGTPADEFDSVSASGSGYSDFQSTVSFPRSGPVFDLPPGYTVNSVSAGIVNNQFVPEPSTFLLGLLGAVSVGWFKVRRRLTHRAADSADFRDALIAVQ